MLIRWQKNNWGVGCIPLFSWISLNSLLPGTVTPFLPCHRSNGWHLPTAAQAIALTQLFKEIRSPELTKECHKDRRKNCLREHISSWRSILRWCSRRMYILICSPLTTIGQKFKTCHGGQDGNPSKERENSFSVLLRTNSCLYHHIIVLLLPANTTADWKCSCGPQNIWHFWPKHNPSSNEKPISISASSLLFILKRLRLSPIYWSLFFI